MPIMRIAAHMEFLNDILHMVEMYLESFRCTSDQVTQICVCVEEIFTNIASYAYREQSGDLEVACYSEQTTAGTVVYIQFRDWGIPYNPLEQPKPDFKIPFENRGVGGLGIHMVRELMDDIQYYYSDDSNILIIGKKL